MTVTGDFASPLATPHEPCPECGEHALRTVDAGIVGDILASTLTVEERLLYRSRVGVACRGCGWEGSALREGLLT